MSIVKLRTMTKKSIIGFGNYVDLTVNDLLALNMISDLVNIYYKLGNCTFTDEILDELKISPDLRIAKPGKDFEMVSVFWKAYKEKEKLEKTDIERMIQYNKDTKRCNSDSKQRTNSKHHRDSLLFSKFQMKRRNQGN